MEFRTEMLFLICSGRPAIHIVIPKVTYELIY